MRPLSLNEIKNSNVDDFLITNSDEQDRFIVKYKGNDLIIDLEKTFENCYIIKQNNFLKIKMTINKYNDILEAFRILYDNICYSIEKNDDINVLNVKNPVINNNSIKSLLINLSTTKTIIKNIENDNIMKINEINNKNFNMYPIITLLNMNLSNNILYMNFYFHSIFLRIIDDDLDIDYGRIKKLML